ncbi:hypothetical protein, partial [Photorhabdus laumondii]|uniref:hypothetical protein n=1 Tax=Photorhabdus laumondii TaxID=2218628 RepID=UPI0025B18E3F
MFVKRGGPFRPIALNATLCSMAADRQRGSPRTPMFSAGRPAFTAGHAGGREAVCAQGRAQSAFHCAPHAHREPANFKDCPATQGV